MMGMTYEEEQQLLLQLANSKDARMPGCGQHYYTMC